MSFAVFQIILKHCEWAINCNISQKCYHCYTSTISIVALHFLLGLDTHEGGVDIFSNCLPFVVHTYIGYGWVASFQGCLKQVMHFFEKEELEENIHSRDEFI